MKEHKAWGRVSGSIEGKVYSGYSLSRVHARNRKIKTADIHPADPPGTRRDKHSGKVRYGLIREALPIGHGRVQH